MSGSTEALWDADPFFAALARDGGDPYKHGFYPQCAAARYDACTPPPDMRGAALHRFPDGDGPLLVYVGAFDLWHAGHSNAVRAAVKAVDTARRMRPSGVLIVPDSDIYAAQKRPDDHNPLARRCLHIGMDTSLKELPCPVHITRLAGGFSRAAPNFTHILAVVSHLFQWRGAREIGLIVGQDNANFAEAVNALPGFFTVIVQRGDDAPVSDDSRVIVAPVDDRRLRTESSTRVRYRAEAERERGGVGMISRILIKDDANMLDDGTRARLLDAISAFYTDVLDVEVRVYRPDDRPPLQVVGAMTVSLDRKVRADLTLRVSRVFADDGKQTAAIDRHVEEPDWEVDPDVPYHLVDDYLDTGGNMATARNWIVARGGTVSGYTIRSFISPGEAVIDLSDFTCAEGTGLLIREHSGELVRVPHLPPRVNLMARASIPPSCWERFADAVLEVLTSPE